MAFLLILQRNRQTVLGLPLLMAVVLMPDWLSLDRNLLYMAFLLVLQHSVQTVLEMQRLLQGP